MECNDYIKILEYHNLLISLLINSNKKNLLKYYMGSNNKGGNKGGNKSGNKGNKGSKGGKTQNKIKTIKNLVKVINPLRF